MSGMPKGDHVRAQGKNGLRVLHVIPSVAAVHGGPTRALQQMLTAMAATNISLEVATTDDDGRGRRIDRGARSTVSFPATAAYFRKVSEFYKFAPGFLFWFWRRAKNYDVVHIHALFSFLSVVAGVICRLRGVPYILRPLGTLSGYGIVNRRPVLKRASLFLIEGPLLSHAAAVHFTSEAELREAEQLSIPFRGVVVSLAVDVCARESRLSPALPSLVSGNGNTVLFLSRLDAKKNVEGLLNAMRLVLQRLPTARLIIAGSGETAYVATLKNLALELDIAAAVEWVGYVEGEAKATLLRNANIYVLPSFSENFGIAVAEALAAGLPCVVAEGVAISSDIAEYGAGIVVSTDPQTIASGVISLLEDADRRQMAARNASRLAVERFSTEAMRAKLSALYNNVVKRVAAIDIPSAVA